MNKKIDHTVLKKLLKENEELKEKIDQIQTNIKPIQETIPGVLHEISTSLMIIQNTNYFLQNELAYNAFIEEKILLNNLKTIDEALNHINDITSNLKNLKNLKNSFSIEKVNLDETIQKTLSFLHLKGITIHFNFKKSICLYTNTSKIIQVFTNIFKNAYEALMCQEENTNKTLTITATEVENAVLIKIEDNGPGMTKETLKKIWTPFYSTKQDQGNTGIGMAITYNIMEQLNATIKVNSSLGNGTLFTLRFNKS